MTVAEYAKLIETAPTLRWKCFYALAYTSGARFVELFNLTWADIDFERGRLHIENREGSDRMPPFQIKDHEARFVQLPSHTINLLAQYQSVAPEGVPYVLLTKERYEHVLDKWRKYRKAGKEQINDYRGLSRTNPLIALSMMLALFSLAGIPPLSGFVGKFFLFSIASKAGFHWLVGVAAVNSTISLYYYLRIVRQMYIEAADENAGRLPVSGVLASTIAALNLAVVFLGIIPVFYESIYAQTSSWRW